jgi:hypothetical protein
LVNAETFRSFFSAGESWGRFSQRVQQGHLEWQIELLGGKDLTLRTLGMRHEGAAPGSQAQVSVAGTPAQAQTSVVGQDVTVTLQAPHTLTRGQVLAVRL